MNSTALATIQRDELASIQEAAKILALSNYFDGKGNTPQAIAMLATKILAGREIGIGPFASVNGIHIINGKPAIGANLMAAAVKASGRYDYRVRELSGEVCKIEFFQRAGEKWDTLGISEFSKADAAKAQTKNMDKFPKNMLFARAMSNGVRFYTPDIFSGNAVYVPEELGAEVDQDGNVIDVTPRQVEPTTGEIIDALTSGPLASPDQLRRLNEIGLEYYKAGWPVAIEKWIVWATDAKAGTLEQLNPEQADAIIEAIEKRIAKRLAEVETA